MLGHDEWTNNGQESNSGLDRNDVGDNIAEINVDENNNDSDDATIIISDKRLPQYKRKIARELRLKGEKYIGYSRPKNKVAVQNIEKDERKLGVRCQHLQVTAKSPRGLL